jgi:ATP-dependent DNA helicase RecQ
LVDAVELVLTSDDAFAPIDASSVEQHRDFAESRLRRLVEYAETTSCRRALILDYFGDDAHDRCEACDNCTSAEAPDYPPDLLQAIEALRDEIASRSGRDPTRVFELRTAREVATSRPRTQDDLLEIWGIGETRASWLGPDLLRIVAEWERANPDADPPTPIVPDAPSRRTTSPGASEPGADVSASDPLYQAVRSWRLERARADGVPAYTLFSDRTLRDLVASRPGDRDGLLATWGLGEAKVERFGEDLLHVLQETTASGTTLPE